MRDFFTTMLAVCSLTVSTAAIAVAASDPNDEPIGSGLFSNNHWDESATPLYYDSVLHLAWSRALGDRSPNRVGFGSLVSNSSRNSVSIPVEGNDFLIACGPGAGTDFASRENADPTKHPVLVVNGGQRYEATRDTALNSSSILPLGANPTLKCRQTILVAFDSYRPAPNDKAVLVLSVAKSRLAQTFDVYHPAISFTPPVIPFTSATRIVADFRAKQFHKQPNLQINGDILTGSIHGEQIGAIHEAFKIPSANEYYLTVVMQLGSQWPDYGGKLPGLADTGMASNTANTPLFVKGVNCDNAGWGGRVANGCRWSARTGWSGRQGDQIGVGSYYYATHATTLWGQSDPIPSPVVAGKWFAYIQRVKLNSIGNADGLLSYWFCNADGCKAVYHRNDIAWRAVDLPQSKITEAWAMIYCGGRSCNHGNYAAATASLLRMTVTDGLPNFAPIAAELKALNGG